MGAATRTYNLHYGKAQNLACGRLISVKINKINSGERKFVKVLYQSPGLILNDIPLCITNNTPLDTCSVKALFPGINQFSNSLFAFTVYR